MPKILISKAFSFFILKFVLSLTNGTTYQEYIIMEEIIYGKPLLPRAVSVEALPNFILKIKFNNNETRYFDGKKIYNLNYFKLLQNEEFFKTVHVSYGSVAWNNGIDYCPDCLYEESCTKSEI